MNTTLLIMDCSIHNAIEAGSNHVVFIIRKDIEKEFKAIICDRIVATCASHNATMDYVFQDLQGLLEKKTTYLFLNFFRKSICMGPIRN